MVPRAFYVFVLKSRMVFVPTEIFRRREAHLANRGQLLEAEARSRRQVGGAVHRRHRDARKGLVQRQPRTDADAGARAPLDRPRERLAPAPRLHRLLRPQHAYGRRRLLFSWRSRQGHVHEVCCDELGNLEKCIFASADKEPNESYLCGSVELHLK